VIEGSVPGARGDYLVIRESKKKPKKTVANAKQ
jgi:ribosomal protein L3